MKKIATITFHASYNYGSCLQAYALQEYIKKICDDDCEYKIVNLRTDIQKETYKNIFDKNDFKSKIKQIILFKYKNDFSKKEKYFEEFIKNSLQTTKEYSSLEELKNEEWKYDYYIAGSDQLWNLQAIDFDWANYLEFIENGKKISYAASFGPKAQNWNEEEKERVRTDLFEFDNISVREKGSFNNVKELTGINAEVNVDPTMLLDTEEWNKIIASSNEKIREGKYIFLYNLKGKKVSKIAKLISKRMKLPVIVSRYGGKDELIYGFEKEYATGPIEFLNLIKNAELVLSSSFHGTIFSILLNKPFFAINGEKDLRINTLLEKMGLQDRSICIEDYKEKCKKAFDIDFSESEKLLEKEREKSKEYLMKALDIK